MSALNALEHPVQIEILIIRVRFPSGTPNGVALARMTRIKRPSVEVLFASFPERPASHRNQRRGRKKAPLARGLGAIAGKDVNKRTSRRHPVHLLESRQLRIATAKRSPAACPMAGRVFVSRRMSTFRSVDQRPPTLGGFTH
jgi:hypothetical protein